VQGIYDILTVVVTIELDIDEVSNLDGDKDPAIVDGCGVEVAQPDRAAACLPRLRSVISAS